MIKRLIKIICNFFGLDIKIKRIKKNVSPEKQNIKIIKVGSFDLYANEGHLLDYYSKHYPSFNQNFAKISVLISQYAPKSTIIDIGANIGDTLALLRSNGISNNVICIEGNPYYFELLTRNAEQFKNVSLIHTLLGEQDKEISSIIDTNKGTAKLITSETSDKLQIQALDNIIKEEDIKLIKIDTDGYDLLIIEGAINTIKKTQPVLFIEYNWDYFSENNSDGIKTLCHLHQLGYEYAFFYDNFGRFLTHTNLRDKDLLINLDAYIRKGQGAFHYYDICLIHGNDNLLAETLKKELMNN